MKLIILAFLALAALLILVGSGFAENGSLALFADPDFTQCFLVDASVEAVPVYVLHKSTMAASGVHFRIVGSAGFTGSYLSADFGGALALGSVPSGVGVSYGACATTNAVVATVTYLFLGTSAPCSYLSIEADPTYPSGQLVAADCDPVPGISAIAGGRLYVNPNVTCDCAVSAERSTWGRVKALYTDD